MRAQGTFWRDLLFTALILAAAVGICILLSQMHDDNNPFAVLIFVLAVTVIALGTSGYAWGIVSSVIGVFCVNYMFTYPFWSFDMSISGYPLTFLVMLVVSIVISTLTTRVKQAERLKYEIESEKLRADLLRALSHDLRTPLASIDGADSLLLEQPNLSEEERRSLLEQIRQETRWLTRITENMLSVTRVTGERVLLRRNEEVVEEIVDSAVIKLRRCPEALPVTVQRPKEILTAPMDATLMEQVILNLLENASVHAQGATRIWVMLRSQNDGVTIAVEDDGAGFDSQTLAHLFDRTALPHPKPCADGRRGLGLGLTVCYAIVKAHGGEMTAENRPEGGARVSLWLPGVKQEEENSCEAL